MTRNLEVSFNSPQCGWMSIGFSDGASEFHTTTAHAPYETALADLMRLLTSLFRGDSPAEGSVLRWNRDPEAFDFHFAASGAGIKIEIFQFPTDEREEDGRELMYSYEGSTADVVAAFAETFAQLYVDRETDEFEFNWRQPFPFAEYEEFRNSVTLAG